MSEAEGLLRAAVTGTLDGPCILYGAWRTGALSDTDLRELVPTCWAYIDWPEEVIGAALWVPMFRAAGLLIVPTTEPRPNGPLTLYRGAPERRRNGMAWTLDREKAVEYQTRSDQRFKTEPAHLYRATVEPPAVLAVVNIRRDREIIVDPACLAGSERIA